MAELIVTMIIGLGIAFFALHNTTGVSLVMGPYRLENIPLYLIVVSAFLLGLFLAWIIETLESVSNSIKLYAKERTIKSANQTINDLERKVTTLELENAKLKGEKIEVKEKVTEKTEEKGYHHLGGYLHGLNPA